jgi:hypothetical protein
MLRYKAIARACPQRWQEAMVLMSECGLCAVALRRRKMVVRVGRPEHRQPNKAHDAPTIETPCSILARQALLSFNVPIIAGR